jgi:hypothetical protein
MTKYVCNCLSLRFVLPNRLLKKGRLVFRRKSFGFFSTNEPFRGNHLKASIVFHCFQLVAIGSVFPERLPKISQ